MNQKNSLSTQELFSGSQDVLDKLAAEALEDLEKGRTEEVDWDKL